MSHWHPRQIKPEELPKIQFWHILTGMMGYVYFWTFLANSPFFIYYSRECGFSDSSFGFLRGVVFLTVMFQLVSSYLERICRIRKLLWAILEFASRAVFMCYALGRLPPLMIVAVMFISRSLSLVAEPIWFNWFTSYMPDEIQTAFINRRLVWLRLGLLCSMLAGGAVFDFVPDGKKFFACQTIMGIVCFVGLLDVVLHTRFMPETCRAKNNCSMLKELFLPMKDGKFRRWIIALSVWSFAMNTMVSMCLPYLQDYMGFKESFKTYIVVVFVLLFIGLCLGRKPFGRIVDKGGTRGVIIIGHAFWVLVPLFFIYATKENAVWIMGICFLLCGMIIMAGAIPAWEKVKRELSPESCRTAYVSVLTICTTLSGAAASFLSGWFVSRFGIYNVFVLGYICRASAFSLFFTVQMESPQMGVLETGKEIICEYRLMFQKLMR